MPSQGSRGPSVIRLACVCMAFILFLPFLSPFSLPPSLPPSLLLHPSHFLPPSLPSSLPTSLNSSVSSNNSAFAHGSPLLLASPLNCHPFGSGATASCIFLSCSPTRFPESEADGWSSSFKPAYVAWRLQVFPGPGAAPWLHQLWPKADGLLNKSCRVWSVPLKWRHRRLTLWVEVCEPRLGLWVSLFFFQWFVTYANLL